MAWLTSRRVRPALAIAGALVALALTSWLLAGGSPGSLLRLGAPTLPAVPIPAAPPASAVPPGSSAAAPGDMDLTAPPAPPPRPARETPGHPGPAAERYALETGPFSTAEAADRVEDEINRLGHPTVRFRVPDPLGLDPPGGYHVRHGRFGSRAQAQARRDELARFGIPSRVVKVR